LLYRFARSSMQGLALALQEAGIGGLARECVAKGKLVGGFLDRQLRRGQLLDPISQSGFIG
jgi:hypothetical protein